MIDAGKFGHAIGQVLLLSTFVEIFKKPMKISENTVVTVTYKLHANLPNESQKHIETADASAPLKFLYGVGMMIPGFEHGLQGKGVGDSFSFSIAPEDAYGSIDTDAVVSLPIDIFFDVIRCVITIIT